MSGDGDDKARKERAKKQAGLFGATEGRSSVGLEKARDLIREGRSVSFKEKPHKVVPAGIVEGLTGVLEKKAKEAAKRVAEEKEKIVVAKRRHSETYSNVLSHLKTTGLISAATTIVPYNDKSGFTVGQLLGSGNNSTVNLSGDGELVVKVFDLKKMEEKKLGMFIREQVALNLYHGEGSANMYYDRKENKLYLTMPRARGMMINTKLEELFEEADTDEKLVAALKSAFQILTKVLEEIHDFHKRTGFVHGDAWLNNMMIDDKGNVSIIDLGSCCPIGTSREHYQQLNIPGAGDYHTPPEIPSATNKLLTLDEAITEKADLHAIFASFVFNIIPVFDKDAEETPQARALVAKFIKYAMENGCNSLWFKSKLNDALSPDARDMAYPEKFKVIDQDAAQLLRKQAELKKNRPTEQEARRAHMAILNRLKDTFSLSQAVADVARNKLEAETFRLRAVDRVTVEHALQDIHRLFATTKIVEKN